jgi:ParB family chromosome partitioning protein
MSLKKKGLGRGLEVLLGASTPMQEATDGLVSLPLTALQAGRYQPRQVMDESGLEELADSIRRQGVLQPIVVRPISTGTDTVAYEIIAGERRFRATKLAGLTEIPAVVKAVDDQTALAMALIENLQRRDLSALEEAQGISRLIEEFGLTHEQAAQAVGRSRSATTNLLRLLQLPQAVQAYLREGQLEAGHARVLLTLPAPQQRALAELAVAQGLSVRDVEERARRLAGASGVSKPGGAKRAAAAEASADWRRMEEVLSDQLGLVVALKPKGAGGELRVQFNSPEEFEGLLQRLVPANTESF